MSDPLTGRLLGGRYEVGRRIARGGMATVYEGLDRRLDRVVAIKVMHANFATDPDFVARFIREARSAAGLSHPDVVAVYDQGSDGGTTYLVMEYVDGVTLRQVLRQRGRLEPADALQIAEQMLAALAAAHRSGIVHRDVKPENVILTTDGRVKVADFGLARAITEASGASTLTGNVILGTVAYLAPEVVERGRADPRTDVYAAGIVLFEMLTGDKPFTGPSPIQVAFRHVHERVPAPSTIVPGIDPRLDQLVLAATAREPARRVASAGALLEAVTRVRRGDDPQLPGPDAYAEPAPDSEAGGAEADEPTVRTESTLVVGRGGAPDRTQTVSGHPTDDAATGYPSVARRRRRRGWILAVVIVALGAVLAGGTYWWTTGRYTTTPRVTEKSQGQAKSILSGAGLQANVELGFSETSPEGLVIATRPPPGAKVRDGGTVTLVVSKGQERFAVPPVAGKSVTAATALIEELPLRVSPTPAGEWSATVAAGLVTRTMPPIGEQIAKRDAIVTLYVSKGPEPVAVPTVVGKTLAEAQQALKAAGLAETHEAQAYSDTVPKDSVVSQTPQNATVLPGSTVTLVLSKGQELFAAADVQGKDTDDAVAALKAQGFKVSIVYALPSFLRENIVLRQNPGPGAMLPRGATVTIYVV